MIIRELKKKKDKKSFIKFIYSLYAGDENFVDTNIFHVKSFLYGHGIFMRQCRIKVIQAVDDKEVLCQCMLIIPPNSKFLQIAFFDATAHSAKAVDSLLEFTKQQALQNGLDKIIIGINGHICYGAGILIDNPLGKIGFDSPYNKPYYADYFNKNFIEHGLCTYYAEFSKVKERIIKFESHMPKNLTVEKMNKRKFPASLQRFCYLSNHSLSRTDFYTQIPNDVFLQLLGEMKILLKNENLLFLKKDGKDIGFLFWHPDYNSALLAGKKNSMLRIFMAKFKKIRTMKVNAIGGLESENIFLPLALAFKNIMDGKCQYMESNFVWDSNALSYKSLLSAGFKRCRKYCVYEWRLNA